jgi:hypothetical protein
MLKMRDKRLKGHRVFQWFSIVLWAAEKVLEKRCEV